MVVVALWILSAGGKPIQGADKKIPDILPSPKPPVACLLFIFKKATKKHLALFILTEVRTMLKSHLLPLLNHIPFQRA